MFVTRRFFLISSTAACITTMIPGCTSMRKITASSPMKTNNPQKALVAWYSQTGHTKRYAGVIAKQWRNDGLDVHAGDIRNIDKDSLPGYDLIAIGSPVFYYDVPRNMKQWIDSIPKIPGTPVATFVSHGGRGGNVHNTAVTLAELLSGKGGAPVGIKTIGNMSAFPPQWASGSVKSVLKYSHLPNQDTYNEVRDYAGEVLARVCNNESLEISREVDFRELIKDGPATFSTKVFVNAHTIDAAKCVGCGICQSKCPVNAIDIKSASISIKDCILCFGCINNCPAQAHDMEFMGKKMYGFNELLKRNDITIAEPV